MSDFKPDIWRLQAQFNTQGLVEALANDDAGIRRRAAAALRALGAYHAIPELEAALESESDPETRANMLAALATLHQERERKEQDEATLEVPGARLTEVDRLLQALQVTTDPDTIIQLARKLGDLGAKQAVDTLVVLFNNAQLPIRVRLAVAEVLLKLESAPIEVALLGALSSPQWRVRRNSAAILGQLRAVWAVEPLAVALRDEHEMVRRTAYAALRNIGTPEALRAIRRKEEDQEGL